MMMNTYYGVPFRVNGTGPRMRFLIRAWTELGEEPIPRMELWVGGASHRLANHID